MSRLLDRLSHSTRIAVTDDQGALSHAALCERAARAAAAYGPLEGARVVMLASPGCDWLAAFLGIWLAGGVAVPLSAAYPAAELAWFADDAEAVLAVVSADLRERAADLARGRRVLPVESLFQAAPAQPRPAGEDALLLYTSGTTGKPKGARLTHDNLDTHTRLLATHWQITPEDRLLHALPLHHLHGLAVALLTTISAGASARLLPRFDVARVAQELGGATVWMAVPTMYHRLREQGDQAILARAAPGLRLATSGSAALPATLASYWETLAGAIPLERFGMTEVGVALSNPLDPAGRRPGTVGHPLPTVDIRIDAESELWVRGPSVFPGYHNRPEATAAAFENGWFRTGDVAEQDHDGRIRLLGRTSVDILKSGGYKLSALEIEETLREHPQVLEVAVVGIADEAWGERVVAAVVLRGACGEEDLRAFAKAKLAAYKVPRDFRVLAELPKNAMGKVVKPELKKLLG